MQPDDLTNVKSLGYAVVVIGQWLGIILLLIRLWRETRKEVAPFAGSTREFVKILSALFVINGLILAVLLLLIINSQPTASPSRMLNLLVGGVVAVIMLQMLVLVLGVPAYNFTMSLKEQNQSLRGEIQELAQKHRYLEEKVDEYIESQSLVQRKPEEKSPSSNARRENSSERRLNKQGKLKENP